MIMSARLSAVESDAILSIKYVAAEQSEKMTSNANSRPGTVSCEHSSLWEQTFPFGTKLSLSISSVISVLQSVVGRLEMLSQVAYSSLS